VLSCPSLGRSATPPTFLAEVGSPERLTLPTPASRSSRYFQMTDEDDDSHGYLLFMIALLVAAFVSGWFLF
jgi:hypothetical protein